MTLEGVLPVLAVPFDEQGELDLGSLQNLVDYVVNKRVDGVVMFGLASEVYKLTDAERDVIARCVVETVDGRVPVILGCEHTGLEAAGHRAAAMASAGADALMCFPPSFVVPSSEEIVDYYRLIAATSRLPVIVQDAPAWTGVPLPIDLLTRLGASHEGIKYVKIEVPPTGSKITSLQTNGSELKAIGGYGAMYVLEELQRGAVATMPGCAWPTPFLEIFAAHHEGDLERARRIHSGLLPLLVWQMSSLDVFVEVQKIALANAGVILSPKVRRPHRGLDRAGRGEFDTLLAQLVEGIRELME